MPDSTASIASIASIKPSHISTKLPSDLTPLDLPTPHPLKRSYANVHLTPTVCYADEFDAKHVQISHTSNAKSKVRSFNITTTNGDRVLLQLDAGGKVPSKFGVDFADGGKTYLRLTIPDKKEMDAMLAVPEAILPQVLTGKDVFWPKKIADDVIRSNFNRVFANAPNEKEDSPGEYWHGSIKMMIPQNDDGSLRKGVSIVDHDGSEVALADLPGRNYSSAIFELGCLYVMGQKSGITKKLVKLLLVKPDTRFTNVDFLPKRVRKE